MDGGIYETEAEGSLMDKKFYTDQFDQLHAVSKLEHGKSGHVKVHCK